MQVSKQSKSDTGFSNSFYLDDLNRLINNSGSFGKGLDSYLHNDENKRSIIIGDPLQIEPVVTAPGKLIIVLNGQYKTDSLWLPLRSSAQILADRITAGGTWMKQGEKR